MNSQVYYLSSLESTRFEEVRECEFMKKMHFRTGKECALVRLKPPVIGQPWGLTEDLEYFVLACRHEGGQLFPVNEFPCFVHIARYLKDGLLRAEELEKNDLEIVAWGELYRSYYDAQTHRFDSA